jgi:hypothetical protein
VPLWDFRRNAAAVLGNAQYDSAADIARWALTLAADTAYSVLDRRSPAPGVRNFPHSSDCGARNPLTAAVQEWSKSVAANEKSWMTGVWAVKRTGNPKTPIDTHNPKTQGPRKNQKQKSPPIKNTLRPKSPQSNKPASFPSLGMGKYTFATTGTS